MSKSKKNFYAIKRGKNNIKNKIVSSWSECEKLVSGVSSAQYKGFKELEEAEIYLGLRKRDLTDDEIILMSKSTNEKAKKKKSRKKNIETLEIEIPKDLYNLFSDKCSKLGYSENDIIKDMIKEWLI